MKGGVRWCLVLHFLFDKKKGASYRMRQFHFDKKKKPIMGRANFSLARVQADRLYVICVIEYLVFVFFFPVSLADKHKL